MNKNLVIYNLSTDLESEVLAFTHDWIVEFSKIYNKVIVFSTYVGKTNLPLNCDIYQLGSREQSSLFRIIYKYMKTLAIVRKLEVKPHVFYHMNHKACLVLGIFFKSMRIKQILWYSHSKKSIDLKIASEFVNHCVSTNLKTFPFRTKKLVPIGHGIDEKRFQNINKKVIRFANPGSIIAAGRVVPIKRIESMINALKNSNLTLSILGPRPDESYLKFVLQKAKEFNVKIELFDVLKYQNASEFYSSFPFAINCTPESVDKAILEEAMCGCIPVSDNFNVLNSTGMDNYWQNSVGYVPNLEEQIQKLCSLNSEELVSLSTKTSQITTNLNGASTTTRKIRDLFLD